MAQNNITIPVLMYHHVNPEGSFINVKPEVFERHIKFLQSKGFSTINTQEFLSIMRGISKPPPRPVMITFDDGWLDNWVFAFPVLKKYNAKAVIFVITSWLAESGRRNRSDEGTVNSLPSHRECQRLVDEKHSEKVMMSWDELSEMGKSGLIDIQSHTRTHQRWDRLYDNVERRNDVIHEELAASKKIIEDRLGNNCNSLCWPWGKYDSTYIEAARSAGYDLIFTTEKGTNTTSTDPFGIKRIVIGNIDVFTLRKKLFIHSRQWLSRFYLKYFKSN